MHLTGSSGSYSLVVEFNIKLSDFSETFPFYFKETVGKFYNKEFFLYDTTSFIQLPVFAIQGDEVSNCFMVMIVD
jgi:hypothetical protein